MTIEDTVGLGLALANPEDALVDVVLVHGLGGHRKATWTSAASREYSDEIFWPEALLPSAVAQARIFSFGYNSNPVHFLPWPRRAQKIATETTIDEHSGSLLRDLVDIRRETKTEKRPIIFIAHSMGGLILANALGRHQGGQVINDKIVDSAMGAIFLGTPFKGSSKAAWASVFSHFLKHVRPMNVDNLVDLEERSEKLGTIHDNFIKFRERRAEQKSIFKVHCFYEDNEFYVGMKNVGKIVNKVSTQLPGIAATEMPGDHISMCKFEHRERQGFKRISGLLNEWINVISTTAEEETSDDTGAVTFNGPITNTQGVIAGIISSRTKDGLKVQGQTTNNYYGANATSDGWNK